MSKTLLICASPRGRISTSYKLLDRVNNKLQNKGELLLCDSSGDINEKLKNCDNLLIAYPLYVDSLPSITTRLLESIGNIDKKIKVYAISNCGFPEAMQNIPSLAIIEEFAMQKGFEYMGHVAIGMGGMAGGISVDSRMYIPIKKSLDSLAEAIDTSKEISIECEPSFSFIKGRLKYLIYLFEGNRMWKRESKGLNLRKKPYMV